jgi:hypothetical protein
MLRLFFHRESFFVKIAYWSGASLTLLFFLQHHFQSLTLAQKIFFILFLAQTLYAQAVELYPWYPKGAAGPGIRLQFQKALVPVSYIWLTILLSLWIKPLTLLLIIFNALLLPVSTVACILIYFHCKDPDPSCPNVLSGLKKSFSTTPKSSVLVEEV